MSIIKWLNLQLFADGGGAGDGGAATASEGWTDANTGVSAVDPERQRLEELGVPKDKIKNRNRQKSAPAFVPAVKTPQQNTVDAATEGQVAADTNTVTTEDPKPNNASTRKTWEEIKEEYKEEYGRETQGIISSRVKEAKAAADRLSKLTPVLEAVGAKYGVDTSDLYAFDIDSLAAAVQADPSYFRSKADELGTTSEIARDLAELNRLRKERETRQQQDFLEQKKQEHYQKLAQQAAAFKAQMPSFDLMKEMQNPRFAAMTGPGSLMSVEEAYFAIHRQEMLESARQSAMQEAERKMASVRQKNAARPMENGASSQGASIGSVDYSKLSKEQKIAFKNNLREQMRRGAKVYPR